MNTIYIIGCGALGSWIGLKLCHLERRFILVDDDIVEADNIITSAYLRTQIGVPKVRALAVLMHHKTGCQAETNQIRIERSLDTYFSINGDDVVIDALDNVESRVLTTISDNVIHAGVDEGAAGNVIWNGNYTVPGLQSGVNPVCTHLLGVSVLQLVSSLTAQVVFEYLDNKRKINYYTSGREVYLL